LISAEQHAAQDVQDAVDFAEASPEPDPTTVMNNVYADEEAV